MPNGDTAVSSHPQTPGPIISSIKRHEFRAEMHWYKTPATILPSCQLFRVCLAENFRAQVGRNKHKNPNQDVTAYELPQQRKNKAVLGLQNRPTFCNRLHVAFTHTKYTLSSTNVGVIPRNSPVDIGRGSTHMVA